MKLTIEIGNPTEVEQVLQAFRTLNLESIRIVVDKYMSKTENVVTDLLTTINCPIKNN